MLEKLFEVENLLPDWLDKEWASLDVDYHPPRVERLWRSWGEFRVSLHRIHPCENPLFHPHPWPSAMRILSGTYEMVVGYGAGETPPPIACRLQLSAGTCYEMVEKDAWHWVRPLEKPAYSLMISGLPWARWAPPVSRKLPPLSSEASAELLAFFKDVYWKF
jgi:hypothetical protein